MLTAFIVPKHSVSRYGMNSTEFVINFLHAKSCGEKLLLSNFGILYEYAPDRLFRSHSLWNHFVKTFAFKFVTR